MVAVVEAGSGGSLGACGAETLVIGPEIRDQSLEALVLPAKVLADMVEILDVVHNVSAGDSREKVPDDPERPCGFFHGGGSELKVSSCAGDL